MQTFTTSVEARARATGPLILQTPITPLNLVGSRIAINQLITLDMSKISIPAVSRYLGMTGICLQDDMRLPKGQTCWNVCLLGLPLLLVAGALALLAGLTGVEEAAEELSLSNNAFLQTTTRIL